MLEIGGRIKMNFIWRKKVMSFLITLLLFIVVAIAGAFTDVKSTDIKYDNNTIPPELIKFKRKKHHHEDKLYI